MTDQPDAKRARLMSSLRECDLLSCNSQSGDGQDKDEHCPAPTPEDPMTSDTTAHTNIYSSHGLHSEVSTGAQQANGHCNDSEGYEASMSETAPTTLPSQHINMPTTANATPPWRVSSMLAPPDHPGWTRRLSPSFSPMHSTAPEISKWAQSPGIRYSLEFQREDATSGRCMNLQRAAPVLAAMQQTDDFDFPGFMFPYGAWGMKRPLKNQFLPKRPTTKQRSKLYISATPEDPGTES